MFWYDTLNKYMHIWDWYIAQSFPQNLFHTFNSNTMTRGGVHIAHIRIIISVSDCVDSLLVSPISVSEMHSLDPTQTPYAVCSVHLYYSNMQ